MLKKSLLLVFFISLWLFTYAQDQIIYKYNNKEYVDSILSVKNDTLVYSNFKKIYKVPLSNVEAYIITIRSKENMEKDFYMRDREFYNLSGEFEYQERKKIRRDTVIYRTHVIKSAIPFKGDGNYEFNLSYEKFSEKKTSFNTSLNFSIINNLDLWLNQELIAPPERSRSYNIDGYGISLTAAYRYYFIPVIRFRPGGIYIGLAAQPSYTKVYCDLQTYYNDILYYSYSEEAKTYGVNIGGLAGMQFLISSRICLDFELSVYGSISKFKTEKTVYYNDGHELRDIFSENKMPLFFHINFGYAFD